MNVIVSNKQKEIIDNANIDAIKDLNGLFSVDDLVNKFKNYFFSKMVLDATSVINFTMPDVLEKLAREIGTERLIILLPANPEPPKEFIEKLKSLNINQFSTNIDDIVRFVSSGNNDSNIYSTNNNISIVDNNFDNSQNNVSSIDDMAKYQKGNNVNYPTGGMTFSDTLANFNVSGGNISNNYNTQDDYNNLNNGFQQNNINTQDAFQNYNMNAQGNIPMNGLSNNFANNIGDIQGIPVTTNINTNELLVGPASNVYTPEVSSSNNNATNMMQNTNMNINDGINNVNGNTESNSMNNSFFPNGFYSEVTNQNSNNLNSKKVIGFVNITEHAGSTTLVYLVRKTLEERFHKKCVGIEINKNDFKLFQDSNLISSSDTELSNLIKNTQADIILVDLNNYNDLSMCDDLLYLVEPSIIKINKLVMENRTVFKELVNKKVLLNKSLLQNNDIETFGKEAGINIFMSIPPLNDRINNEVIARLITVLNLN